MIVALCENALHTLARTNAVLRDVADVDTVEAAVLAWQARVDAVAFGLGGGRTGKAPKRIR